MGDWVIFCDPEKGLNWGEKRGKTSLPAGIPELAKESTSRDVKSGGVNLSFSKSEDHGSLGIMDGAASTSFWKARVRSLLTFHEKGQPLPNVPPNIIFETL